MEYTYGQCHALALALHQQTGWQLAGCNWEASDDDPEAVPEHIFVVDDDGHGVDIHGRYQRGHHPDPGIRSDWRPISAEQVRSWTDFSANSEICLKPGSSAQPAYAGMDSGRAEYTAQLMLGISDTIIIAP